MDMRTLMAWRATNRSNYADACTELRDSLKDLLAAFVPNPAALLSLLTNTRALISGELAICYLLQEPSFVPQSLDIYVGSIWYDGFVDSFGLSREISGFQLTWTTNNHVAEYVETRGVTESLEITLSNGKTVIIHAAASPFACHAIACSPSSLGTTFVTEFSFATAYPRLTFHRRAIICRNLLAEGIPSEQDMYARLEANGFSFEDNPAAWPEYSGERYSSVDHALLPCLRSLYLCPQQGRYFGDDGSMVCFMDTLSVDVTSLKDQCIPPYGVMAVWRLQSTMICGSQCDEFDDILAPGVFATSIMFKEESFRSTTLPSSMIVGCTTARGGYRVRARSLTL